MSVMAGLFELRRLSPFGHEPEVHRLLADHFLAEMPVQTFGQAGSVEE